MTDVNEGACSRPSLEYDDAPTADMSGEPRQRHTRCTENTLEHAQGGGICHMCVRWTE